MKASIQIFAFAIITCFFSTEAFAHGGGLNAQGCHNNRKTGGYHCHRSSPKPKTSYNRISTSNFNSGKSESRESQQRIKTAQYLLNGLGYDSGVPDGITGDKTIVSVIQFQRDQSLSVTGLIDETLLLHLAAEAGLKLKKIG